MAQKNDILQKLFSKEYRTLEFIKKASAEGSEKTAEKLRGIYSKSDDEYIKNYALTAEAANYNHMGNGAEALKILEKVNFTELKKAERELCDYYSLKADALILERAEKLDVEIVYTEAKPYFEKYKADGQIQLYTAKFESYFGDHSKAIQILKAIDFADNASLEFGSKFALAMEYIYVKKFKKSKQLLGECAEIKPSRELTEIQAAFEEQFPEDE